MVKSHFGPDLGPWQAWAEIRAVKFFSSKIWLCQSLDYHGQLSSCTISEKTDDPVLRKLRQTGDIWQTETAASSIKCQFILKKQCSLDLSISISWDTKNAFENSRHTNIAREDAISNSSLQMFKACFSYLNTTYPQSDYPIYR